MCWPKLHRNNVPRYDGQRAQIHVLRNGDLVASMQNFNFVEALEGGHFAKSNSSNTTPALSVHQCFKAPMFARAMAWCKELNIEVERLQWHGGKKLEDVLHVEPNSHLWLLFRKSMPCLLDIRLPVPKRAPCVSQHWPCSYSDDKGYGTGMMRKGGHAH